MIGSSAGVGWSTAPAFQTRGSDADKALPQLKSYREADGRFHFKLEDADGTLLLESRGFDSPREAGQCTAALVEAGDDTGVLEPLLREVAPAAATALPDIARALAALKADRLARRKP
jgi:tryptophanyl-tRNA synthetase